MTIAAWNTGSFAATCDAAAGYTGTTVTATSCDSTADAAYVVTGCALTDCIAPTTSGYTITTPPDDLTKTSWNVTNFAATCDAAAGYTGTTVTPTVCANAGEAYTVAGCALTDCLAPTTPGLSLIHI